MGITQNVWANFMIDFSVLALSYSVSHIIENVALQI